MSRTPCPAPGCSHVDDSEHPAGRICPQPGRTEARDSDPLRGGCTRDGVIVHRPALPATRAECIELARSIIADLLVPDDGDQLDAEPVGAFDQEVVTFRVQVPDEVRAGELEDDVREAILNAGFSAVWFGDLEHADGAVRVAIHVKVGAP